MHRWRWAPAVLALGVGALACTPKPPPRWAEGGAPLLIAPAVWHRGDDTVEIRENGQVLEDGDLVFVLDRVGRVVDEDYEPAALLFQDGQIVGTDNRDFGRIGLTNASPPGQGTAWLALMPNGAVIVYDSDGDKKSWGNWKGCQGLVQRTCTLATHLLALRNYSNRSRSGVGFGVGVGVGIPIR
jgi:hypothetical protein